MGLFIEARIELVCVAFLFCVTIHYLWKLSAYLEYKGMYRKCNADNHRTLICYYSTTSARYFKCNCGYREFMVIPEDGTVFQIKPIQE